MNDKRRTKIKEVTANINRCLQLLDCIADEEMDAYNNLPEAIADSDTGARMEEAEAHIRDAVADLESALANLDDAIQ